MPLINKMLLTEGVWFHLQSEKSHLTYAWPRRGQLQASLPRRESCGPWQCHRAAIRRGPSDEGEIFFPKRGKSEMLWDAN